MVIKSRQKPVRALKKEAWKWFSMYIRLSESKDGWCTCVTCGTVLPWREAQAGHFMSRRFTNTMFNEMNVHPQCSRCNIFLNGNLIRYYRYMVWRYGQEKIDNLDQLSKVRKQFSRGELTQMIEIYKQKVESYGT